MTLNRAARVVEHGAPLALAVALAIVVAAGAAWIRSFGPEPPLPFMTPRPLGRDATAGILVGLAGWLAFPGLAWLMRLRADLRMFADPGLSTSEKLAFMRADP